jgi:putative ABC transport system permease protein
MPSAESGFKTILNDLKNNPHVRSVSVNEVVPTAYWDNYNTFYDPVTNKELSMKQAPADAGYIPTYQIPLVEGKNFDDALAASQGSAVLINRTAMNALGWKTAVGRQIKSKGQQGETYHVIGVMEDFHYRDLQYQIEPLIQWYAGPPGLRTNLSIRTDHGYMKPVMDFVEQAMKKISSRRNFNYEMMSTKVDKQYELLQGILRVTNYIAVLTIIIASLGMFGLISLFARQRVREIGIRKVLGASVNGIVKLLSRDFLILVGIAALIACPLALYIMTRWLQDFAYRINISWWMFVVAGLLAIVIVFITVGVQSIKSALANPVKSLRSE